MKLAFSTLGCPDRSFTEVITMAKDMGFDGIEIRGIKNELYAPDIKNFKSENIDATIEKMKSLALTIPCLSSACYLFDVNNRDKTVAECIEYIKLAGRLNTPYVRVLADKSPYPTEEIDDEAVAQSLLCVADIAKDNDVVLLVETNGVYASSTRLKRLLNMVNKPESVAVLWDIHHPYRYFNERPQHTFDVLGDSIRYVHIKDSVIDGDGKLRYKMLGSGSVPNKEALLILKKNGYDGFVSLEWVKRWYSDLEEPGIIFMQFVSYMRRLNRIL